MRGLEVCAAAIVTVTLLASASIAHAQVSQPVSSQNNEYPFTQTPAPTSRLTTVQQAQMRQVFYELAEFTAREDGYQPGRCDFPSPEREARYQLVKEKVAQGATKLHSIGINAIPDLVHGMYHRSRSVQSMCAQALAMYGKPSVPSIIWGCKYFGVKSPAIVEAFRIIGPPAYDALTAEYSDTAPGLKKTAVDSIAAIAYESTHKDGRKLAEPSPANLATIRQMLADPSDSIRQTSVRIISVIGNDTASLQALERIAVDENQNTGTRDTALYAMESIAERNNVLIAPAKSILKNCMSTVKDASVRKSAEAVAHNIDVNEFISNTSPSVGATR